MGFGFAFIMCVVTAILAARKGYNPALWFFAAGCIGLLVLAFLPFSNQDSLPVGEQAALKRRGDIIGGVFMGVSVLALLLRFVS